MAPEQVEVEKKYDVGDDAEVPALAELPGVARVGAPHVDMLEAVYFDTGTHALAARGITLRRRTGGADAGWHLKLAAKATGSDDAPGTEPRQRRELHAPLGQPAVVPDSLLAHIMVYLRGEDPGPVVRLETQRTTYPLYAEDGVHLADLADDRVTAERLAGTGSGVDTADGGDGAGGGASTQQWREWELELVHGGEDMFPPAEEVLAAAGARPAGHQSKLAKALAHGGAPAGGDAGTEAGVKSPEVKSLGKKDPVSDLLTVYLEAQLREILRQDPGIRLEEPEAVHDLRSATRRARSALWAYRRFYNALAVRHLRAELKWLGRVLGVPRDAEVMLDRLRAHAADLPPGPASDAVKDRLEDEVGANRDAAHRKLQMVMVSARYFELLDGLELFLDSPPVRPNSAAPALKAAAKLVAQAAKRLKRTARTAKRSHTGAEHETALHQVRKDAKRLRHVAESVEPVYGKRARKIADAAQRQQKILGDFHDSVVARDLLATLSAAPDLPEHVASAYVTLHTLQVQLAADAEERYRKEWKKSRRLLRRGVT